MAKCFFEEMIKELDRRSVVIDGRTLKRFIGGQCLVRYRGNGWLLGYIEDISIGFGTLEVSAPWIAVKKIRERIWRFDDKRSESGFLIIQHRGDCLQKSGTLLIPGAQNSDMILIPKGSNRIISKKKIRGLIV